MILRPIRFLLAVLIGALIFFSNVYPAAAIGGYRSDVTEGEANLQNIKEKSEDALKGSTPLNRDRLQTEANKGLNEIQGAADAEDMKRPSNTKPGISVEERIEKKLEDLTNK